MNKNISGGHLDGGGSDVLYRNLDCDTSVQSTLQMVFINSALDILDIEYGNSSKCIGKNCKYKCQ